MKIWMYMLISSFAFLLSACGQQQSTHDAQLKAIEVEIIASSVGNINEEIPIQAKVSHGTELVEDAEVTFEFVKGDKKEQVKAENKGKGVYAVERVFAQQGTYEIIAHTNAKDMHTMPKETIEIR